MYALTANATSSRQHFVGVLVVLAFVVLSAAGCTFDDSSSRSDAAILSADVRSPVEILNDMDPRAPVPLQPMMAWHQKQNMQNHLVAIQEITESLSRQDWEAVANASLTIESSPQMQMQCEHMGAGADGFTEMALEFHRRADAIGVAARDQDINAVLRATAYTLEACTRCHAVYRQDVVDVATWEARTATPTGPMSHGDR